MSNVWGVFCQQLFLSRSFWDGVGAMEHLLKSVCACLGYLEGDDATFSSVYPCFLSAAVHIVSLPEQVSNALLLEDQEIQAMLKHVWTQFRSIYCSGHILAFFTDPFFDEMRENIEKCHGRNFRQMGISSLLGECQSALSELADSEVVTEITRCWISKLTGFRRILRSFLLNLQHISVDSVTLQTSFQFQDI